MPTPPITIPIEVLANGELLAQFQKRFTDFVLPFNDADEADLFVKNISPVLERVRREPALVGRFTPELVRGYQDLFTRCQFLTLDWLSEGDIVALFRNHFSLAMDMSENLDLWSKIRIVLLVRYIL